MSWFDIIKAERPTLDELSDQPVAIQDLLDRELPEYLDQQNVWEKQVRVFTSPSPSIPMDCPIAKAPNVEIINAPTSSLAE